MHGLPCINRKQPTLSKRYFGGDFRPDDARDARAVEVMRLMSDARRCQ